MARGFESKDVEFQQAESERSKSRAGRAPTPGERDALNRRHTIELTLVRARADLLAARAPAHRRMLEEGIAALEQQLSSIDREPSDDVSN